MITFLKMKLQNKVLRWLCIVLAIVAVLGALAAATGAFRARVVEDEDDEDEDEIEDIVVDPNVILITDCESFEGFKGVNFGGKSVWAVSSIKPEGDCSIGSNYQDVDYVYAQSLFTFEFFPESSVNISDMTHFVFDIYVSNPTDLNGNNYTIELNSAEKSDYDEIQTKGLIFSGLVEGWNTVKIPLANFTGKIGSFDASNLVFLRMYNGTGYTYDLSGEIYFDNIRFEKEG